MQDVSVETPQGTYEGKRFDGKVCISQQGESAGKSQPPPPTIFIALKCFNVGTVYVL